MRTGLSFAHPHMTALQDPWFDVSSGFAPNQISGCTMWLRSDRGVSLNGSNVSAWADQTGSGNSVIQATGANQPGFSGSGGPNGLPTLTFNGSTQFLSGNTNPFVCNSFTFFMVVKAGSAAGSNFAYSCGNTGGVSLGVGVVTGTKREVNWNGVATSDDSTNVATTANEIWTLTGNSAPVQTFRVSGVEHILTNAAVVSGATLANQQIGARGSSIFWNGNVTEVIAFNRALTLAEITRVEAYLSARYAISVPVAPPIGAMSFWLRSDLGTTIATGVSQWADQSHNGQHATQPTGANQPALNASDAAYNGQPTVQFSGSPQEMLVTLSALIPQPCTVYVVGESSTGVSQGQFYGETSLNTTGPYWNGSVWSMFAGTGSTNTTNTNKTKQAYATVYNGASSALYIQGGSPAISGNYGSNGIATGLRIFSSGGANYGIGKLVELIIYPTAHNAAQVASVLAYLGTRYAITIAPTPPIANPFAWYRSDLGITQDGSQNVSQWNDLSGNVSNLTQGSSSARPAYNTSNAGLNGRPSLTFSSASSQTLTNLTFTLAQPYTVFLVGYTPAGQNCAVGGAAAAAQYFGLGSTNICFMLAGTQRTVIVAATTSATAMAGVFNGASSVVYGNLSTNNSGAVNAGVAGFSELLVSQIPTVSFYNATFAEILVYPSALSQGQVSTVLQYLAALYSPGAWL